MGEPMPDLLAIYEREAEEREARTCPECKVEEGSRRDNDDGRQVWFQFAQDDMKLMPCEVCRPREAMEWPERYDLLSWYDHDRLQRRIREVEGGG